MHNLKAKLKQLIPASARQPLLNSYHLMQAVSANVRHGFPTRGIRVIMITGTNGKTTTATLVAQMLISAGYKVGVNTTAYYSYGDTVVQKEGSRTLEDSMKQQAIFAAMRKAGCEYIVLEATSQGLDQHRLWGVKCDVAVMTNLTQDHLDYHGTMERYAEAKGKLFAPKPRIIILNRDDEWFEFFNKYEAGERKVTYGTSDEADCRIASVSLHKNGSDIKLVFDGDQKLALHTHLPGKFNVYNVAAAASVGYYLKMDLHQIATGIDALDSVPGRLQRVDAGQPFEVIVDYAHTPDALKNVLSTLKGLTKGKLTLVFGATGDRDKAKRPIMGKIAAKLADRIFVTDEETYTEDPAAIRAALLEGIKQGKGVAKTTEVADRRQAILKAFKEAKPGDIVLLTGMGHELTRNMGGVKEEWNDAEVAKACLKQIAGKK